MALLPSPAALVEISRYAVGQVVETAASLATVPFRVLGLLGQTELLVSRMTMLAERAEGLIGRVDGVVGEIEHTLRDTKVIMAAAALAVDEASAVAARAAVVVDATATTVDGASALVAEAGQITGAASGVIQQASATSVEARRLLDGYAPALHRAAPLAVRFIEELTPEEVTAAIRMIDELPQLRKHLTEDVMPLLGKLDQVGPDLHSLLEVTNDLHLAIIGLPGLKMLRRRGEEKVAEDDATNDG